VSQTGTVNGAGVDLQGFNGAAIEINAGLAGGTSPSFTFQLEESDDDSVYTAVASADLQGTEPVVTTANDNTIHKLGYLGNKRYLRVAISAASGTSPTLVCSATVIRGRAAVVPTA